MKKIFRPLGEIIDIVSVTGLDVSYAYEDLVFSEHSVFIIKFDDTIKDSLHLYFNSDCDYHVASDIEQKLIKACVEKGMNLILKGSFKLKPNENSQEIEISFIDALQE